jgi:antitoxin component HigA of HigAB toxin-antitoxin module
MKTKTALVFPTLPKDYARLCRLQMPRPIHDRVEYANVAEVTDKMSLWQDDFTVDQRDYFDLLCGLLEEYDRVHVQWPKVSVQARLRHLLDESGMSAADLSRLLGGSQNLGAMILRGDRNLIVAHIRKLAEPAEADPILNKQTRPPRY